MKSRLISSTLLITACLFSLAVSAASRNVEDLVGKRARNADPALQSHGYVHIDSQRGGKHHSWGMWWNPSLRECLTVAYRHGRVEAITSSPAYDCNQTGYHTSSHDDDNAGAALAIGAAALIGALAVSHKSHHHESGRHRDDHNDEVEFERGHRDGLYNHSFDDHKHTSAYQNGYNSGVEQRDHDTSYRVHSGRHDRGYRQTVDFSDLNGARASSADSALSDRGFRNVDGLKSGNTSYTYWYNRSTGQCLQMTVAGGRAEDIRDIGQHPACR